jgi:hypothetical protein
LIVASLSPANIARCAAVIVTPDDNKIIVFHKGNPQALIVVTPTGGHTQPIPTLGDNVQWKKPQKKLKVTFGFLFLRYPMPRTARAHLNAGPYTGVFQLLI